MINTLFATTIQAFEILFPVGIILLLAKLLGVFAKKIGLPQAVAMLFTGILIGLFALIPGVDKHFITEDGVEGIRFIAEIGVILIMFSAGLGTDLKQIKAVGKAAAFITVLDVVLCIAFGFILSGLFNGWSGTVSFGTDANGDPIVVKKMWSNVFYGVILSATSVSVTIATLKELGRLNSKIGTCIISAAILDDLIGVIVLSVVLSLSGSSAGADSILAEPFSKLLGHIMPDTAADIVSVIVLTLLFFVFVFIVGYLVRKIFAHLEKKYSHHRRIPIYGLGFCFIMSFFSQFLFGIADITGAYFAGLILAGRSSSEYMERRTDIASYIIFTPVFFAKIGITTDWKAFASKEFLTFMGFGLCLVLAGILGKFIGASTGCKVCGYSTKDAVRCGMAMTVRAEVCLVSAQKGIDAGIVDPKIQVFLMVLIMVTSFVVPLLLKASYKNEALEDTPKASPSQAQLILDRVEVYKHTHDVLNEEDYPDIDDRYGPNDYY